MLIDGRLVEGSTPARLRGGVIEAPVAPYVRELAKRIERQAAGGRLSFERDGRSLTVVLGSAVALNGNETERLPIAPYLRGGQTIVPLAAVARALGASVEYDPVAHTMHIQLPAAAPLATLAPAAAGTLLPSPEASPAPAATFAPTPVPANSGIPRPRRTPIVVNQRG